MPRRARTAGATFAVSAPSKTIRPRSGRTSPETALQRRRLAGAVGAEQRHDLAGADVQVDVADRPARRRSRRSGPRCSAPRRSSGLDVERVGRAAGAGAAEVGLDHAPGRGARPRACRWRSPCRTRARRSGRRSPSTRPMSWSTSSIAVPPSTTARRLAAQLLALGGVQAGRRARRGRRRAASPASARATPTSLRSPCESSDGQLVEPRRPARRAPSASRDRGAVARRLPEDLADGRPQRRPLRRDGEVLAHGEVVEQLDRPATCAPARCARARAAPAARARGRRARRARSAATKPVIASMNVVLPAPLGPISPTRLPSGDLELDVDERVDAAEADRDAVRG